MSINEKELLAETIRHYNLKGWSPATATNYSFKDTGGTIWVSRSGVDKSQFTASDFITVDSNGTATGEFSHMKPSAETLIHCAIYALFPKTKVILHSHSIYPILISAVLGPQISFEGYEIQKGFDGQTTHENYIDIPIFENTQDMQKFKEVMTEEAKRIQQHAFIIRKHGTYAWGKNILEAKRHLETLDYLCQCEWLLKNA